MPQPLTSAPLAPDNAQGNLPALRAWNIAEGPLALHDDASVGTLEWQDEIRHEARAAVKVMQRTYIQLGAYLTAVATTRVDNDGSKPFIYEAWGFASVYDYALRELGLHARKTDFLRRIYDVVYEKLADLDPAVRAQIVDIDYSKVRELVNVLTVQNAADWVSAANRLTYEQLTRAIADYKARCIEAANQRPDAVAALRYSTGPGSQARRGNPGHAAHVAIGSQIVSAQESIAVASMPDEVVLTRSGRAQALPSVEEVATHRRAYLLYDDQNDIVQKAFNAASAVSGSDKQGHLLTLICMDYLATQGAAVPGTESFVNYLGNLERLFNVDLIAVDRSGTRTRLLAGQDHLMRLADELDASADASSEEPE